MNAPATVIAASRAERVQHVESSLGIKAWLVEDYAVPLVAMDFAMRGGAAQDPADKPGVASMLSGLLDEGAGSLDAHAYQQALDELAIRIGFGADRDAFSGRMQTLARHTAKAFELLRLAVCEARLDEEPLARVRGQMAANLRNDLNDPDSMAARAFRAAAFPGHPYGRPAGGEISSLDTITRHDLDTMRAHTFARDNLVIGVVGAIDAATLAKHLDEVFGALPARGQLTIVPPVEMAGVGTRQVLDIDVPQANIRFGRNGIARKDANFIPAVVVNHILGGGAFTARLFREVREKRGLAYSVYSQMQTLAQTATLMGGTSTKNERAGESLAVITEQIRDLGAQGPTDDELAKAKLYLTGSYALGFDTSTKIASQLVHLQLEGFAASWLDERNAAIDAVTPEAAAIAAKILFGDGSLLVTIAGRPEGL